jgi:hypothetical protein
MRKRVASINEAPIAPGERRIAVDAPAAAPPNAWLREQGLAQPGAAGGDGAGFPLGGGSQSCY